MKNRKLSGVFLVLVLLLFTTVAVRAVPPQPTTLYGKVQVGGADVPDGTPVTAWIGSTQTVGTGSSISFPEAGLTITFISGCTGEVTARRQAGETQVVSQDGYTSVYALDVLGPSGWDPPADPATEGMTITLKISDTVVTTETWSMGTVVLLNLTVDSLAGALPYTPANVQLVDQVWDIDVSCSEYTATATFEYDDSLLGDVEETELVGMARFNPGYNRWEYIAGTVNTSADTVTVDGITAFSRWKLLASVPPRSIPDLTASRDEGDLVLDWSAVTEDIKGQAISGVTYNVYRAANDPYFAPGGTPYAITSDSVFTDTAAIGDPNIYYYVVTASDASGIESEISDRMGKFMRTIEPGMNLVSSPIIPSSVAIQDFIGAQLTGATSELYADRIWIWDTDLQDYDYAWLVDGVGPAFDGQWWDGDPWGPSSIVLEPGTGFWVQSRQASTQDLALLGAVSTVPQQPVTIVEGMQLIGSAYPMEMTLYQATFAEDGAYGAPSELYADRVWYWDTDLQDYDYAWLVDGIGPAYDGKWWDGDPWGETTITLRPGNGYWYQRRGTGSFVWTHPMPVP